MEKIGILEYYMSDDTPQCFPKYVQCYNGHNSGADYPIKLRNPFSRFHDRRGTDRRKWQKKSCHLVFF